MLPAGDVLAEAVRLAGATLMTVALGLVLLQWQRPRPLTVAIGGALLLTAGSLGLLIATVAPIAARLDEPVLAMARDYLQHSTSGPALLLPLLPALYALMLFDGIRTARSPGMRRGLSWMLAIALAATAGLIGGVGHSATGRWDHLAMILLAVHVICGVAWVGLVLALLPGLLPGLLRGDALSGLLRRWGNVAAGLVFVLIMTGLAAACLHGTPPPWPLDDRYGQLLGAKLVLLLAALAAAGWNRHVELAHPAVRETRVRAVLGVEAVLLVCALTLAAWLSRTPPPA